MKLQIWTMSLFLVSISTSAQIVDLSSMQVDRGVAAHAYANRLGYLGEYDAEEDLGTSLAGFDSSVSAGKGWNGEHGSTASASSWVSQDSFVAQTLFEGTTSGRASATALTGVVPGDPPLAGEQGEYDANSYGYLYVYFVPLVDVYYQILAHVSDDESEVQTTSVSASVSLFSDSETLYKIDTENTSPPVGSASGVLRAGYGYYLFALGLSYIDSDSPPIPGGAASGSGEYSWDVKLVLSEEPISPDDSDNDGVPDSDDAYPNISLDGRLDTDHDGIPNDCDVICIDLGMLADDDDDGDGHIDTADNCPLVDNIDQADANSDGIGDACDLDNDGVRDDIDNCPSVSNAIQWNLDKANDGGDACDDDDENDGWLDGADNCPLVANPGQENTSGTGRGDACYLLPAGC